MLANAAMSRATPMIMFFLSMGNGGFGWRGDAGATWKGHRVEAAGMQRVALGDSF
tara:strand:- start:804 stop:968 length:165 start_codon:yes stop_codon:yes gene_type:complete